MSPTKPFMFIQQKNAGGSVSRYYSTSPLPPSRDFMSPALSRLAVDSPTCPGGPWITRPPDLPGNPKRWTWTLVQIQHDGGTHRHYLRRSPEGKLLLKEEFLGRPYLIIAQDVCRPEFPNAEPEDHLLRADQARRPNQSWPIVHAQISPQAFVAVYTLPNGEPQLPEAYTESHRLTQKQDGSWVFLPKNYHKIPECWYTRYDDFADRPATGAAKDSQSPQAKSPASEGAAGPSSAIQIIEPIQPASVSTANLPRFSAETSETNETQDTSSVSCTEASRSDPEITESPDEPISTPSPDKLDELQELIARFLICSDDQRAILALWILHTYCYQRSLTTPYLNIFSPVEESGKSVCMGVLRFLCAQPWWASGVPASTLTRNIIADRPTVLLDDWHTTFRGSDKQQVTGFLLNGCHGFQPFTLMEGNSQNGFSAREVNIYCPKAFAGMASLPPTLAQRSIPIVLKRRKPHEIVSPVSLLLPLVATQQVTSWMQDWSRDNLDQVMLNTVPAHHGQSLLGLSPHQQDSAHALLGLAETVGGHWPQTARAALLNVFQEQADREASPVQLLSDVRNAFARHRYPQRIFTAELLEHLHNLDHRPWSEWSKGQPLTAQALSTVLRKSFNISSRTLRRGLKKARGYQQSDFADSWERYLPGENAANQETSRQSREKAEPAPAMNLPHKPPEETQPEEIQPEEMKPEETQPWVTKAKASKTQATRANLKSSNQGLGPAQTPFPPIKTQVVSMSQLQATWAKGRAILKQFAGKALGL